MIGGLCSGRAHIERHMLKLRLLRTTGGWKISRRSGWLFLGNNGRGLEGPLRLDSGAQGIEGLGESGAARLCGFLHRECMEGKNGGLLFHSTRKSSRIVILDSTLISR